MSTKRALFENKHREQKWRLHLGVWESQWPKEACQYTCVLFFYSFLSRTCVSNGSVYRVKRAFRQLSCPQLWALEPAFVACPSPQLSQEIFDSSSGRSSCCIRSISMSALLPFTTQFCVCGFFLPIAPSLPSLLLFIKFINTFLLMFHFIFSLIYIFII